MANRYEGIDLHRDAPSSWPATIPELTAADAERAVRRLWRWAEGGTCPPIVPTSGNRYTWTCWQRRQSAGGVDLGSELCIRVNASRGWRHLAHDLSHLFFRRANPGARPHDKAHARFEARLVREIIKRGWLEPRSEPLAPAPAVPVGDAKLEARRAKLARVEASIERWQAKQRRAERALAKLARQRSGLARWV
jgi:hypothetical protein